MGSYEDTIAVLEAELAAVEWVFGGLSEDEWRLPTKLVPVDPDLPYWTVFELAGHFDISIGLTRMLISGRDTGQPARDRTSFFINPRSETAPVVYDYAYTMVEGKTPADMPAVLRETFSKTLAEARGDQDFDDQRAGRPTTALAARRGRCPFGTRRYAGGPLARVTVAECCCPELVV